MPGRRAVPRAARRHARALSAEDAPGCAHAARELVVVARVARPRLACSSDPSVAFGVDCGRFRCTTTNPRWTRSRWRWAPGSSPCRSSSTRSRISTGSCTRAGQSCRESRRPHCSGRDAGSSVPTSWPLACRRRCGDCSRPTRQCRAPASRCGRPAQVQGTSAEAHVAQRHDAGTDQASRVSTSRWRNSVAVWGAKWRASVSAKNTERCWPPVQPMATVR